MNTGAAHIIRLLLRNAIRTVSCVPSADNLLLLLAAHEQDVTVISHHTLTNAVQSADGIARRNGRPAFVFAGVYNDIEEGHSVLFEAKNAGSPVIVVRIKPNAVPARKTGTPKPVDEAVREDLWKDHIIISQGADLGVQVRYAMNLAKAQPGGPVLITILEAVLSEPENESARSSTIDVHIEPDPDIEHVQLRRAAQEVDQAKNPLIWAGGGALRAGAGSIIGQLAERIGAPIITTQQASGLLPSRHPCFVGLPSHMPLVGFLWDEADVVIAIGTDFDEFETQAYALPDPDRLISINLSNNTGPAGYSPTVLLRGDAKTMVKALVDNVSYRGGTAVIRQQNEEIRSSSKAQLRTTNSHEMAFIDALDDVLDDRTIVVTDHSNGGNWVAAMREWTIPRTLIIPANQRTTTWAVPAFVGAAVAQAVEEQAIPLLGVTGEQGLIANLDSLVELAIQHQKMKIPATLLVIDDGGYGNLRTKLQVEGLDEQVVNRPTPDFISLIRTIGLRADSVDSMEALPDALAAHMDVDDPTVLVVRTALTVAPTDPFVWYRRKRDH